MIETPTNNQIILEIPAGQWFAPDSVASQGQLVTMVQSRYARYSDGATLEAKGQFLFRWQIAEKKEEIVNQTSTPDTINWSALKPIERDELVAIHVMHLSISRLPTNGAKPVVLRKLSSIVDPLPCYTQDMSAAWQIVERITDATVTVTNVPGAYHHARIKPFAPQRAHHGFRLNAAEAICVAALRAAGFTILHSEEDIINAHNLRSED